MFFKAYMAIQVLRVNTSFKKFQGGKIQIDKDIDRSILFIGYIYTKVNIIAIYVLRMVPMV